MEPITTTALISTAIGYLSKSLLSNKPFKDFTNEFSQAAIDWIKPIFLKEDNTSKEVLSDLEKSPEDNINIQAAEIALAKEIRNNPKHLENLKLLISEIEEKDKEFVQKSNSQTILGNNNVGIQDVSGSTINIKTEDTPPNTDK